MRAASQAPLSQAQRFVLRQLADGDELYLPTGNRRAWRFRQHDTHVSAATVYVLEGRRLIRRDCDRWVMELTAKGLRALS